MSLTASLLVRNAARSAFWTRFPRHHELQARSASSAAALLHEHRGHLLALSAGCTGRVTLRLDVRGVPGVAVLLLQNADKANALSPRMMVELHEAVERLEQWDTGRAVIIAGEGGKFCAGADLSIADPTFFTPEVGGAMCAVMTDATRRLRNLPMVSVAAIEGGAIGGGAELAVSATFALMTQTAQLQFAHVHRNLCPGWGGHAALVESVGRRYATWLLLSGSKLNADAAASFKLIDSICAPPQQPLSADTSLSVAPAGAASPPDDIITAALRFLADEAGVLHRTCDDGHVRALHALKRGIDAAACSAAAADEARIAGAAAFATVWGAAGHRRDVRLSSPTRPA